MNLPQEFLKLFTGLMRAHGTYIITGKPDNKGKRNGKAVTLHAEVTEKLWEGHLSGRQGIGIVPIDDEAEVHFMAIDIDDYQLDHIDLAEKIVKFKLPIVQCRSKSGGAHLYTFFNEPVSAKLARSKAMEWVIALGYSGIEIFPKQIALANKSDVGNWINMPYFNANETERFAIYKGKKLSAEKFIQYANKMAISLSELEAFTVELGDGAFADGPPCLQTLAMSGFPQGTRNMGLFNLGVYARNKFGDIWQEKLEEFNRDFMSPPLGTTEVSQALRSLGRKTYFYTCDKQPIVQCCNKEICKKREFGIGGGCGDDVPVTIGTLTRINSEVPTFFIDVEGVRMEVTPESLLLQDKFRLLCIEKISKLPTRMKQPEWEAIVRDRLDNQEVIEAPRDAGPTGQFYLHLETFLTNRHKAKAMDELLLGKPFPSDDGRTYFRSMDLMKYLDQMHFRDFTTKKVWSLLRDIDGKHDQINIKGKCVQHWSIPSPSEQTEEFEKGKF